MKPINPGFSGKPPAPRYETKREGYRGPLSQYEIDKLRHMRTMDADRLARMLPEWAKNKPIKPFVFIPNQPPKLPNLCTRITNEYHRAWVFERFRAYPIAKTSAAEYVECFDLAAGLKPHPVHWVKVPDGNYA